MSSRRILVVEDAPDIAFLVARTLKRLPAAETVLCDSGSEALARADIADFDLYLLDVMMPGMDGPTLLAEITARREAAPRAAFLTAKATGPDRQRLLATGAIDVLIKPFDPRQLLARVGELLD